MKGLFHRFLIFFGRFFLIINPVIALFKQFKWRKHKKEAMVEYIAFKNKFVKNRKNVNSVSLFLLDDYHKQAQDYLKDLGFSWKEDGPYVFSDWVPLHPWILFARKGDDCDGFAYLNYKMLKDMLNNMNKKKYKEKYVVKLNTYILFVENDFKKAHAATVLSILDKSTRDIVVYLYDNLFSDRIVYKSGVNFGDNLSNRQAIKEAIFLTMEYYYSVDKNNYGIYF